jgi:predicted small lipoprotein YifL
MRKAFTALALAAALATSGCGLGKPKTPDEFQVARNAPLIIPPDFSLAPPVAGTGGITAADAQQQAIDALFGGPAQRSPGETSLLDAAGRNVAQMGIRSQVWDPDTRLVDKGQTTVQILTAGNTQTNVASAQTGQ